MENKTDIIIWKALMEKQSHIGEKVLQCSGLEATIIDYWKTEKSTGKVLAMLEDGNIVEGLYQTFLKGQLYVPGLYYVSNQKRKQHDYFGYEVLKSPVNIGGLSFYRVTKDGEEMLLTPQIMMGEKRRASIQKEIEKIVEDTRQKLQEEIDKYSPIGITKIMNNGLKATIIDYENFKNVTIQFENGAIRKNIRMDTFNKGKVALPKKDKEQETINEEQEEEYERE